MRKTGIITVAVFYVLSIFAFTVQAENQKASVSDKGKKITIEIDYGGVLPSKTVEVPLVKGKTILEELQTIATVETHPVGQYVFVTSIDGVAGQRGEMAWYYTIDGMPPGELAYSKGVENVQCVKWIYKKDECSWRVDGDHKQQEKGGVKK
ncbi:MAG TPA: DUF4430 domain-containing protein [Smithellaceae bacterium]|nr:DUF4430 domain-containing protein [Smithellaceae bacterium]